MAMHWSEKDKCEKTQEIYSGNGKGGMDSRTGKLKLSNLVMNGDEL